MTQDIETVKKTLNRRIVNRRNELGLSFRDLEELTGISRSTLQRYEKNYFENLSIGQLRAISDALNVTSAYLLGEESKNISTLIIDSINSLAQLVGYEIDYDETLDVHILHICCPTYVNHVDHNDRILSEKEILSIYKSICNYTKFELSNAFEISQTLNDFINSHTSDED